MPPKGNTARALIVMSSEPNARSFLRRVLREELDGGETEPLRRMSAGMLAAALRDVPHDQRRSKWVLDAIHGLGAVRSSVAEDILDEIVETRRFVVLHDWPRACRRAAAEARRRYHGHLASEFVLPEEGPS